MNKIDVALESGRDGIGEGACKLFTSLGMIEDREIGLQQTIRLADRDGKLDPITCWGNRLRRNAVR